MVAGNGGRKTAPADRTVRQLLEEHQSGYLLGPYYRHLCTWCVVPGVTHALQRAQRFHDPAAELCTAAALCRKYRTQPCRHACLLGIA